MSRPIVPTRRPKNPLDQFLLDALADSGLSQAKVAERSGVSPTRISRYLTDGEESIRLDTADRLLTVLGGSISLATVDRLLAALDTGLSEHIRAKADLLSRLQKTIDRLAGTMEYWKRREEAVSTLQEAAITVLDFVEEERDRLAILKRPVEWEGSGVERLNIEPDE